jgi:lysophospholipase L1-like esterase
MPALPRLRPWLALLLPGLLAFAGLRADESQRIVEDAAKFKLNVKADPALPTLYLVGDSTMKVGTPGQRGWGDDLARFFDPSKINVVNQAIGGRSSRTYQTEGRWAAVLATLRPGDFVIVQFGHNDSSPVNEDPPITAKTRARGTIRGVGEESREVDNILTGKREVVYSFGWYMRRYVEDIRARQATPIVLSLVPRNAWKDGHVVRSRPDNYGDWARLVAESTGAAFIDHNEIIAREMEKLGADQVGPLFADNLHAAPAGALFNARAAVAGLKALPGAPFAGCFSAEAADIPAFAP